jgi:hypothetical protein
MFPAASAPAHLAMAAQKSKQENMWERLTKSTAREFMTKVQQSLVVMAATCLVLALASAHLPR